MENINRLGADCKHGVVKAICKECQPMTEPNKLTEKEVLEILRWTKTVYIGDKDDVLAVKAQTLCHTVLELMKQIKPLEDRKHPAGVMVCNKHKGKITWSARDCAECPICKRKEDAKFTIEWLEELRERRKDLHLPVASLIIDIEHYKAIAEG